MRGADIYITSGILELYVAGVLQPAEIEEVEAMAARHELVAEEIKRIEEAHIKYAAAHAPELSAGIYDQIARKIEELPIAETPVQEPKKSRSQPVVQHEKPAALQTSTSVSATSAPKQLSQPIPNEYRKPSYGRFYFVISLLLFLLALSAVLSYYLYDKWQSAESDMVVLQSENSALINQNDTLKTKYEEAVFKLAPYNSPDARKITLAGQTISPQAQALVYWNPKTQEVYLQVQNLPQPATGKVYQLWAIDNDEKAVDLGIVSELENSVISPMKKIAAAKSFVITLEQEGGSGLPTMDAVYVKGDI